MTADVGAILRGSTLFGGLDEPGLRRVVACARVVRYPRGAAILREGEPCPGIHVVAEGAIRVFKLAPNGKEHLLHVAQAGQTFAEVAVIGRFACPANADALEDSLCALVSRDCFQQLLTSDHAFCLSMLEGVAGRVRGLIDLLDNLVLHDAASRVARFLVDAVPPAGGGSFELPLKKKDLASHLNLTSETLSRTLRRLVDDGLIEMHDRSFRVLQGGRLASLAEGGLLY